MKESTMPNTFDAPTDADLQTVREQLGREPRGVLAIAARASDGAPTVVATAPRLPDGTPFPTFYYLTHPEAVKAASRLEAEGRMVHYNELLATDESVAESYRKAHTAYIDDRNAAGIVPELDGVSAGGMPTRVKCLHALIGHALAAGAGVNPIGDLAITESGLQL